MRDERYRATGRTFWGPDARLMELTDDRAVYTAICVHPEHRLRLAERLGHEGWLRDPGVEGVAPLVEVRRGSLVHDTGPVWPLQHVLAFCRRPGAPPRTRAGLELLAKVGRILDDGVHAGHVHGVYRHGNVSPWRLLLTPDGEPLVIGFGLGQLDLTDDGKLDVDAYRYCPPERLAGEEEDLTGDLLSLALVGFELVMGEPLFDGDAEAVRLAAARGLGRERLHRYRDFFEPAIYEAIDRALRFHPDGRYPDGIAFSTTFADLAGSPHAQGPSLAELVAWIAERDPEGPTWPSVVDAEATTEAKEERPRWERLERRRSRSTGSGSAEALEALRPRRRVEPDHNAMYPHDELGSDAIDLQVRADGTVHHVRLSPSESLAKSAARLVDVLEFSPVDLTGRIRGWYRLVQGDEAWYGDAATRVVDRSEPLDLEWVPNDDVSVTVQVEGYEPLRTRVGVAVHAQFLVGELRRLLDLDGASWRLFVGDRPLDPWQILDDYAPTDGAVLRLERHRPRRLRRRSG